MPPQRSGARWIAPTLSPQTSELPDQLNELESAEGGIWANKYTTDTLVKFDPETGKVLAYLDLSGLLKKEDETGNEDVLNGIAYRADEGLYYVTGKNWPKMYAIRLVKRRRA